MPRPFRQPVSDEIEPPDYVGKPIEESESKPPSYAGTPIDEKKKEPTKPIKASGPGYAYQAAHPEERKPFDTSPLGWRSALNKFTSPLTEAPTRFAESVSKHINPQSETKGIRGVSSAYVEGLGHAVSDLTSPINLALVAAPPGVGKAIGVGMVGHGAYRTTRGIMEGDPEEAISGAVEGGLGYLGARGHITPSAKTEKEHPPIRQERVINPADKNIKFSTKAEADAAKPVEDQNRMAVPAELGPEAFTPKDYKQPDIARKAGVKPPMTRDEEQAAYEAMKGGFDRRDADKASRPRDAAPQEEIPEIQNNPFKGKKPAITEDIKPTEEIKPPDYAGEPLEREQPADIKLNNAAQTSPENLKKLNEFMDSAAPKGEQSVEQIRDSLNKPEEQGLSVRQPVVDAIVDGEPPVKQSNHIVTNVKLPEGVGFEKVTPEPKYNEEPKIFEGEVIKSEDAGKSPELATAGTPQRPSFFSDDRGELNIDSIKNFMSSVYQKLTGKTPVKDIVEELKKTTPEIDDSKGGKTVSAVMKLFTGLEDARGSMEKQSSLYKQERAQRFAESASVKEGGSLGAAKSLSKMKGEYEQVNPGERLHLDQGETDSLFDSIKAAKLTEAEKINARFSMFKLLNGDKTLNRSELSVLDNVFGNGFANKIVEMHGGLGAVGLKLGKTANTMKSMLNSVNIAAPILHGLPLSSHPLIYTKAAANMVKFMANKDAYNAAMTAIEERPNYVPWRDAGLFIAKPESITASEEDFARSYVRFIPGVRDIIAVSKRGYTGFLNELRSKTADLLEKNAKDQGLEVFENIKVKDKKGNFVTDEKGNVKTEKRPTEIAKNIAKYINNATDRGSLGKLEKIAPELNYLLWSPRRLTARATMLNPMFYAKLDPFTRREALKSLFAQAAIGTSMVSLGVLAGGKTSLDPSNSDFGKVRFGSHTLNPLGPTQSLVVAATKAIKELHRMGSGEKAKFGEQNIPEIAGGLIRNRESPIVRLADEIATAKQFTTDSKDKDRGMLEHGGFINRFGDKKYISNEVRNSFIPIFIQDVEDLLKSDASFAESIGLGAASFVGVSEQNSPIRKKKGLLNLRGMRTLKP